MITLLIVWGVFALAMIAHAILEARPSSGHATSHDADKRALEAITLSVF
jgi:hypothetical protein